MRTITLNIAKLLVLGIFFVFTSTTLATPSYANGNFWNWWKQLEQKYGDCSWRGYIKCKKTNIIAPHAPSSTGLFVSRCNGEVGWWTEVKFQNGSSLCIPASIADFYHNDGSLGGATCTKTKIGHHWFDQDTYNGACRTHKKMSYE